MSIACLALPQQAAPGSAADRLEAFDIDRERQAVSIVYTAAGRRVRVKIDRNDVHWVIEA